MGKVDVESYKGGVLTDGNQMASVGGEEKYVSWSWKENIDRFVVHVICDSVLKALDLIDISSAACSLCLL